MLAAVTNANSRTTLESRLLDILRPFTELLLGIVIIDGSPDQRRITARAACGDARPGALQDHPHRIILNFLFFSPA